MGARTNSHVKSVSTTPERARGHQDIPAMFTFLIQVIAWEDKNSSASQGVMRYGIIIMGSSKAGETGGDDEESPGDSRGSGRVTGGGGSGLRHVRVKLTPGRVETLLSSQVSV